MVVKASQDPATAKKDEATEKDQWRPYACQAAAAFTITLARRFEIESSALVQDHLKEVARIVQILERDAPQPSFKYTVSRAESYALLKEGIYDFALCDVSVLIPNDHTSAIAPHGGGGTGKSTIIKSLVGRLIDSGLCPVLLDLRRYSAQKKKSELDSGNDATVEEMLAVASVPRRNAHELERLAGRHTSGVTNRRIE